GGAVLGLASTPSGHMGSGGVYLTSTSPTGTFLAEEEPSLFTLAWMGFPGPLSPPLGTKMTMPPVTDLPSALTVPDTCDVWPPQPASSPSTERAATAARRCTRRFPIIRGSSR